MTSTYKLYFQICIIPQKRRIISYLKIICVNLEQQIIDLLLKRVGGIILTEKIVFVPYVMKV